MNGETNNGAVPKHTEIRRFATFDDMTQPRPADMGHTMAGGEDVGAAEAEAGDDGIGHDARVQHVGGAAVEGNMAPTANAAAAKKPAPPNSYKYFFEHHEAMDSSPQAP